MHQTLKIVVRLILATCIFLITAALILTCITKSYEIWSAQDEYKNKQISHIRTHENHTYRLLSNNKKPHQAFYIVLQDQGYIAKFNCETYIHSLCIDKYNEVGTRIVQNATFQNIGQHSYIQNIEFLDSQTNTIGSFNWSQKEIDALYAEDMKGLKFIVAGISIFALIAIYCSFRIIRNFRRFLEK